MSIEALKAACESKETYASLPGSALKAVCEPLALGLPLAAELLAIAKDALKSPTQDGSERMVSINVAVHGKPLLAAAEGKKAKA